MNDIPNLKEDEDSETQANPYTKNERDAVDKVRRLGYERQQLANMFILGCWTGLSLSELIALSWEDINLETMTIKVRRAYVTGRFKVPKEVTRTRDFHLLQPAIDILQEQFVSTGSHPPVTVDVLRRSNTKSTSQSIRTIFKNEYSESESQNWNSKSVQRGYKTLLKQAKVKYRGPNTAHFCVNADYQFCILGYRCIPSRS